jgi:hypothetical protein
MGTQYMARHRDRNGEQPPYRETQMSTVERGSVVALVQHARSGPPKRLIITTIVAGLLAAVFAGMSTAAKLCHRAAAVARLDHEVMATVTMRPTHVVGRVGGAARSAVETWVYPAGVTHSAVIAVSPGTSSGRRMLWVDATGRRTAGPAGTLAIAGGVALAVVRTLLITLLVIADLAVAVPVWRKRRLQRAVDARWDDLVHLSLEGL